MPRTALVTQARMGSTRLPGKVLKKVLGKPLLAYHLERLQRVKGVDQLIVATTIFPQDEAIVSLCREMGVATFCGSPDDVLDRYVQTGRAYQADLIVRCTSDCPLIDPEIVDQVVDSFRQGEYDYVSNSLVRTFPRGMDAEIFTLKDLEEIAQLTAEPYDREHVTPYFRYHPKRYRLGCVQSPVNFAHHRWTVDTQEDYLLVEKILEALYLEKPLFDLEDILKLFEMHPEWEKINAHIQQKS